MKHRRRAVSTDRRFRQNNAGADHGTAERWQHSGRMLELTERAGVLAVRATEEHALDVLVAKGWITETQREAALRFKLDYHIAGLEARVIGGYNPVRNAFSPFSGFDERTDTEEAAYRRWRRAHKALGAGFAEAVESAACHDIMPRQQQAVVLAEGLSRLSKYYKMSSHDNVD